MKANFKVDPDFPVIDGVGHSDKIDFFNVKGGGSTNTTLLDLGYRGCHLFSCSRDPVVLSTNLDNCRVGPNIYVDGAGVLFGGSIDCLNCPGVGNSAFGRASDRILLNRVEVSGVLNRPAGTEEDDYSSIATAPKVFVALVLDTAANGSAISSATVFQHGGAWKSDASTWYSAPPFGFDIVTADGAASVPESRFRILAFDVKDFALNPETRYEWVDYGESWNTVGVPPDEVTQFLTKTRYSFWRSVSLGFRFDVDLNDALCSLSGPGISVGSCSDLALHIFAFTFDGVNFNGYTPHGFGSVSMSYMSRLWFKDWLSDTHFEDAGVDGPVVPDDEVPLAILADQSAAMAGDGVYIEAASRDRPYKRTKASHGFYNFLPRAGDAMLFEDDPEFARLQAPGSNRGPTRKSDSRSRVYPLARRRVKAHKFDDNEDYNAREGDRGGKRGKY